MEKLIYKALNRVKTFVLFDHDFTNIAKQSTAQFPDPYA